MCVCDCCCGRRGGGAYMSVTVAVGGVCVYVCVCGGGGI